MSHHHARQLKDRRACEWERIGSCHGPIQVAHVNQNPLDNSPENLLALCCTHHTLLDNGRIDPTNPVMPAFHVSVSGKRRYV